MTRLVLLLSSLATVAPVFSQLVPLGCGVAGPHVLRCATPLVCIPNDISCTDILTCKGTCLNAPPEYRDCSGGNPRPCSGYYSRCIPDTRPGSLMENICVRVVKGSPHGSNDEGRPCDMNDPKACDDRLGCYKYGSGTNQGLCLWKLPMGSGGVVEPGPGVGIGPDAIS